MRAQRSNWLILAIVIGLPCANTFAQQIDFNFQVFKLDAKIADALQLRLIDGGDPAVQAIAKMPDFIKQSKASLEAELIFQAQSGQRIKEASSKRLLEVNKRYREVNEVWEVADGIELDMIGSLDSSGRIIDVDIFASFSSRSAAGVKVRQLTSSLSVETGVPFFLSRWQEGEDVLLLVGTATSSPPAGAATASSKPRQMIYLDVAFYQSAADAQTRRNQVGRITVPSLSGKGVKSEIFVVLIYDTATAMDARNLGFKVKSDFKTDPSGAVDSTMILEHIRETGGRDRLPDGTRVPKLEIREARPVFQMKDGETRTVNAAISSLGNPKPMPDAWTLTVGCLTREVR